MIERRKFLRICVISLPALSACRSEVRVVAGDFHDLATALRQQNPDWSYPVSSRREMLPTELASIGNAPILDGWIVNPSLGAWILSSA